MKQISISSNSTIKSAITKLSKEGVGTLLVVDKNNSFLGTLSDGDIRKAILKTNIVEGFNGIPVKPITPAVIINGSRFGINEIKIIMIAGTVIQSAKIRAEEVVILSLGTKNLK